MTKMTSLPLIGIHAMKRSSRNSNREKWDRGDDMKLIHDKQTGGLHNNTLLSSNNHLPLQDHIQQTRPLKIIHADENRINTANNKINMPSPTRIQTLSSHQYPSGKSTIDNPVTKTS